MAEQEYNLGTVGPFKYDDSTTPAAITTTGTIRADSVPVGATDMIRLDDVGGGGPAAPSDATYVVISLDGDLSQERVLAGGDSITLVDGGANGNVTLDTIQDIRTTANVTFNSLQAKTIILTEVAPGTSNDVLILSGSDVKVDIIDARVWGSSLVDGAGAVNRISYWSDANTITGDSDFIWNGSELGINVVTPGAALHVNGTGNSLAIERTDGTNGNEWIVAMTDALGGVVRSFNLLPVDSNADVLFSGNTDGSNPFILKVSGAVGVGLVPTANMTGLAIEAGLLTIKETTTPTSDTNYGKLYTKSDNNLYFQDGAGTEHTVAYV